MGKETSKYQEMKFLVSHGTGGIRLPYIRLDVCNLCGAVIGNRPAHDVFCYSEEGPIKENYG